MYKQIIVPDVSFWDDNNNTPQKVDFNKMKANGAQGVVVRAGQGNWTDEDFKDYWNSAKGVLPIGVYWFYDSRVAPIIQATKYADLIKSVGMPEMEVWCDYEESYNGPFSGWRNFAVFVAEVERLLPSAKIGVYTAYYYWRDRSPNPITESASFNWFAKYQLWLAWYTNDDSIVKIPAPWTSALYWQYKSNGDGHAYGSEALGIDLSYFQGTQEDFNKRYFGIIPPPDPQIGTGLVKISTLNIRSGASTNFSVVGTIKLNTAINVYKIVYDVYKNQWMRIDPILNKWICSKYYGAIYVNYTPNPIPVPIVTRPGLVLVSSINVRSGPATTFSIVSTLKLNDIVAIESESKDSAGNIWVKIGIDKYACMMYGNIPYIRYNDIPTPIPTPIPNPVPSGTLIDSFIVPDSGDFRQTVHDYESEYWGFQPRCIQLNYKDGGGYLPETVILKNHKDEFHELNEEWQKWWFNLLKLASYGTFSNDVLISKWESLTADSRAFTDNHAVQNGYCDYITRTNLGAKGISLKSLTTGGNLVKVLAVNGTLLTIECLDVSKSPPPIEDVWLKKPWLYQWAGQSGPTKLSNGTYRTNPFPQLSPYGSPVPVVSSDGSSTQIIDKVLCKVLTNGKTYKIYNT